MVQCQLMLALAFGALNLLLFWLLTLGPVSYRAMLTETVSASWQARCRVTPKWSLEIVYTIKCQRGLMKTCTFISTYNCSIYSLYTDVGPHNHVGLDGPHNHVGLDGPWPHNHAGLALDGPHNHAGLDNTRPYPSGIEYII